MTARASVWMPERCGRAGGCGRPASTRGSAMPNAGAWPGTARLLAPGRRFTTSLTTSGTRSTSTRSRRKAVKWIHPDGITTDLLRPCWSAERICAGSASVPVLRECRGRPYRLLMIRRAESTLFFWSKQAYGVLAGIRPSDSRKGIGRSDGASIERNTGSISAADRLRGRLCNCRCGCRSTPSLLPTANSG